MDRPFWRGVEFHRSARNVVEEGVEQMRLRLYKRISEKSGALWSALTTLVGSTVANFFEAGETLKDAVLVQSRNDDGCSSSISGNILSCFP